MKDSIKKNSKVKDSIKKKVTKCYVFYYMQLDITLRNLSVVLHRKSRRTPYEKYTFIIKMN